MTSTTLTRLRTVLLGGGLAIGATASGAQQQEELRIGFLAPTTGIFAQVGKDFKHLIVDGVRTADKGVRRFLRQVSQAHIAGNMHLTGRWPTEARQD